LNSAAIASAKSESGPEGKIGHFGIAALIYINKNRCHELTRGIYQNPHTRGSRWFSGKNLAGNGAALLRCRMTVDLIPPDLVQHSDLGGLILFAKLNACAISWLVVYYILLGLIHKKRVCLLACTDLLLPI